jgi:hypothetical protein
VKSSGTLPFDDPPPPGSSSGTGTPPPPPAPQVEKFAATPAVLVNGQLATTNPNLLLQNTFEGAAQMQFSLDGGAFTAWQAYAGTAVVVLPADGVHTVTVQVMDQNGNTLQTTQTVRLDRSGPTVTISLPAPTNAGSYDVGASVKATLSASDSGIGGATITSAKLDGATISSAGGAATIDVDSLTAGTHTLVVTGTDALGNTTSVTVTITIHATTQGLINAVNDGLARGWVTSAAAATLVSSLQQVLRSGTSAAARTKLTQFISTVQGLASTSITAAFRALLLNWANDLYPRL